VKRAAKLYAGESWSRVSPSSETRLEHIHLMMDATDTDRVHEAASGRASEDVSSASYNYRFIIVFIFVTSSLLLHDCYYLVCLL